MDGSGSLCLGPVRSLVGPTNVALIPRSPLRPSPILQVACPVRPLADQVQSYTRLLGNSRLRDVSILSPQNWLGSPSRSITGQNTNKWWSVMIFPWTSFVIECFLLTCDDREKNFIILWWWGGRGRGRLIHCSTIGSCNCALDCGTWWCMLGEVT